MTDDFSESGDPIFRHEGFEHHEVTTDVPNERLYNLIAEHIKRHIGKVDKIYHETLSDVIHIDVQVVNPAPERNFYTLITTGMSSLPMNSPNPESRYAELMICLPPTWPLFEKEFEDKINYWPLEWIKALARFPHQCNTWLSLGHTVPSANPPEPYAKKTKLCCMLLSLPRTVKDLGKFYELEINETEKLRFYSMIPIYKEEMDYKLKHGIEALMKLFDQNKLYPEIVDMNRKNVCEKQGLSRFRLF
jgi:hypothetical protein